MRRCPECYEIYDEGETFCEVDGRRLLADPAIPALEGSTASKSNMPPASSVSQPWLMGFVGVAVGILFCLAIYGVYGMWTASADSENQRSSYSARTQEPIQSTRPAPANVAQSTETPAEDESADSEAEASPQKSPEPATAPQNQSVSAKLNQGPVSTGSKVKDGEKGGATTQTIIMMQDGTSVEVDAAWEDKQGVWYRRGGLVSFVESQRVKAITARAEPKTTKEQEVAP